MKSISYTIHDSLNIQYIDERNSISQKLDLFKKDYDFFKTDCNNPDLIVKIHNFPAKKNGYYIENDEYIINEDYLSGTKSYKMAKFQYSIEKDTSGIVNVNIDPNLFANRVFHHLLLDNLINIMMFHKGYSNLHCSGIVKNNEAFLISGPGGAGKTSFALYCLSKGYSLLGDDRIFLKNSTAYPFPECPGVEFNNSKYVKHFLSKKAQILIHLNRIINVVSLGYIGAFFSMKSLDVFPKNVIGDKSRVKSIVFLQPSNSNEFVAKKIEKKDAVKKLYINQLFEDKKLLKDIFNYSTAFPKNEFIKYIDSYSDLLSRNLPEDLVGYSVTFPKKDYQSVIKWLDGQL